uniref:DUF6145 family protein n=1 Tax=Clostridium vitabionis TaxID=2784388 RepID=UPI00188BBE59|nr:DUF6145 family protein [Clostridium vitabionis]
MEDGNIVLCGASSYTQKYFLNPLFAKLPQGVQDDLKIMCVTFTAQIGGTILLEFTPEGNLEFRTEAEENDYLYDEIGSGLLIERMRKERRELLQALEMFYRVFVLGEPLEDDGGEDGENE